MDVYLSHKLVASQDQNALTDAARHSGLKYVLYNHPEKNDGSNFIVACPYKTRDLHCAATETGFWYRSRHIDYRGLWKDSSLNGPEILDELATYKPPDTAENVLSKAGVCRYKYKEKGQGVSWDGVVLALQQPHDKSVLSVMSRDDYFAWVEDACDHYGRNLFLKLHPFNQQNDVDRYTEIANSYGSKIGFADHTIYKSCRFVLLFNSGVALDCWHHGARVAQVAPGYWHKIGVVTYTDGEFPDDAEDTIDLGRKLADFLIWKYCIAEDMRPKDMIKVVQAYADNAGRVLFPLPEELSYAAQCHIISVLQR